MLLTLVLDLANKLASSQDECTKLRVDLSAKETELRILRSQIINQHLLLTAYRRKLQMPYPASGSPSTLSPQPGTPMSVSSPNSDCYSEMEVQNDKVWDLGGPPSDIYRPPHPGNLITPAFQSTLGTCLPLAVGGLSSCFCEILRRIKPTTSLFVSQV